MTKLSSLLMASMATDLGIKRENLLETIKGKLQSIIFHHYPPCHHGADKVVGIAPHTDRFCLTALLQVDTTPGLQVSKDGNWFPVQPLPGSFTFFVGDILEVLTNGRYSIIMSLKCIILGFVQKLHLYIILQLCDKPMVDTRVLSTGFSSTPREAAPPLSRFKMLALLGW
jgi:hypothetical protein